jgi:succinoglycan biosynthesis transport protein ExoP
MTDHLLGSGMTAHADRFRVVSADHPDSEWVNAGVSNAPLSAVWGGKYLIAGTMLLTAAGVFAAVPHLPKLYDSSMTIVVLPTDVSGPTLGSKAYTSPLDEGAVQTQVRLLTSAALLGRVVDRLNLVFDPEFNGVVSDNPYSVKAIWNRYIGEPLHSPEPRTDAIEAVRQRLSIAADRTAYTVEIHFRSEDRQKAARIASAIGEELLGRQREVKVSELQRQTEVSQERVNEARNRYQRSEAKLRAFVEASDLNDPVWRSAVEGQVASLSQQLATARNSNAEAQARASAISAAIKAGNVENVPEVLSSPLIQAFKGRALDNATRINSLEAETAAIQKATLTEAERIMKSLLMQASVMQGVEGTLQNQLNGLKADLQARARAEVDRQPLQRDVESDLEVLRAATVNYKQSLTNLEAVQPDAQIVSEATLASAPSFPKLSLTAAGAFAASLLTGFLTAFLLVALSWSRPGRARSRRG